MGCFAENHTNQTEFADCLGLFYTTGCFFLLISQALSGSLLLWLLFGELIVEGILFFQRWLHLIMYVTDIEWSAERIVC